MLFLNICIHCSSNTLHTALLSISLCLCESRSRHKLCGGVIQKFKNKCEAPVHQTSLSDWTGLQKNYFLFIAVLEIFWESHALSKELIMQWIPMGSIIEGNLQREDTAELCPMEHVWVHQKPHTTARAFQLSECEKGQFTKQCTAHNDMTLIPVRHRITHAGACWLWIKLVERQKKMTWHGSASESGLKQEATSFCQNTEHHVST